MHIQNDIIASTFSYSDFEKIHDGIGSNLAILIQWIATFAAALAVGLYRNWMMTLTLLAAMPLVVVPSAIFNRVRSEKSTLYCPDLHHLSLQM